MDRVESNLAVVGPTNTQTYTFRWIDDRRFDLEFADAKKVDTDECKACDNSITARAVGDCIAIFCQYQDGESTTVCCAHFSTGTSTAEVLEYFDDFVFNKDQCDILLVGGNESTVNDVADSLLSNIREAIVEFFPRGAAHIKRQYLDILGEDELMDANLDIYGNLTCSRYRS